jgi:hypothetical protein
LFQSDLSTPQPHVQATPPPASPSSHVPGPSQGGSLCLPSCDRDFCIVAYATWSPSQTAPVAYVRVEILVTRSGSVAPLVSASCARLTCCCFSSTANCRSGGRDTCTSGENSRYGEALGTASHACSSTLLTASGVGVETTLPMAWGRQAFLLPAWNTPSDSSILPASRRALASTDSRRINTAGRKECLPLYSRPRRQRTLSLCTQIYMPTTDESPADDATIYQWVAVHRLDGQCLQSHR